MQRQSNFGSLQDDVFRRIQEEDEEAIPDDENDEPLPLHTPPSQASTHQRIDTPRPLAIRTSKPLVPLSHRANEFSRFPRPSQNRIGMPFQSKENIQRRALPVSRYSPLTFMASNTKSSKRKLSPDVIVIDDDDDAPPPKHPKDDVPPKHSKKRDSNEKDPAEKK